MTKKPQMPRVLAISDLVTMEQHRNSLPPSSPLTCRQRNTNRSSNTTRLKWDNTSKSNNNSNFTSKCYRRKLMILKKRKRSSMSRWQRKSQLLRRSSSSLTRKWWSQSQCKLRNSRKRSRDFNKNWLMKASIIAGQRTRAHHSPSSQVMPQLM